MISSAAEYQFVNGDLNLISINGNVPRCSSNNKLYGEDIALLNEAIGERKYLIEWLNGGWSSGVNVPKVSFTRKLSYSQIYNILSGINQFGDGNNYYGYKMIDPSISAPHSGYVDDQSRVWKDVVFPGWNNWGGTGASGSSDWKNVSISDRAVRKQPVLDMLDNLKLLTRMMDDVTIPTGEYHLRSEENSGAITTESVGRPCDVYSFYANGGTDWGNPYWIRKTINDYTDKTIIRMENCFEGSKVTPIIPWQAEAYLYGLNSVTREEEEVYQLIEGAQVLEEREVDDEKLIEIEGSEWLQVYTDVQSILRGKNCTETYYFILSGTYGYAHAEIDIHICDLTTGTNKIPMLVNLGDHTKWW